MENHPRSTINPAEAVPLPPGLVPILPRGRAGVSSSIPSTCCTRRWRPASIAEGSRARKKVQSPAWAEGPPRPPGSGPAPRDWALEPHPRSPLVLSLSLAHPTLTTTHHTHNTHSQPHTAPHMLHQVHNHTEHTVTTTSHVHMPHTQPLTTHNHSSSHTTRHVHKPHMQPYTSNTTRNTKLLTTHARSTRQAHTLCTQTHRQHEESRAGLGIHRLHLVCTCSVLR